jgi:pimeloyl-ACP methyl ester carboxylesterase
MAADAPPPVVLSHALGLVELGRSRAHRREGFLGRRAHQSLVLLLAPDLIGVLDAIGVEQADVVGLSYGGGTTQTATLRSPERFASMALLATTDHPFEAFQDRALSAETDGMEAQVVPSLTRWFTPAGLAIGAWGVRYARERARRSHTRRSGRGD